MIELAGAWGPSFCIAGGMPGTLQLHIYIPVALSCRRSSVRCQQGLSRSVQRSSPETPPQIECWGWCREEWWALRGLQTVRGGGRMEGNGEQIQICMYMYTWFHTEGRGHWELPPTPHPPRILELDIFLILSSLLVANLQSF